MNWILSFSNLVESHRFAIIWFLVGIIICMLLPLVIDFIHDYRVYHR